MDLPMDLRYLFSTKDPKLCYQFVAGSCGGTEAAVSLLRALIKGNPDNVLVSLDGIGGYDHIRRDPPVLSLKTSRLHQGASHYWWHF